MIDRVGLLNAGLEDLVESAWGIYSAWEYAAQPSQPDYTTTLIDEYKKTFSREYTPSIEFMGLFDCVNSVGLLRDRLFPLSTKSGLVKTISHAVSLDERRGKYRQNLLFPFSYTPSIFSLRSKENTPGNSPGKTTNVNASSKSSLSSSISSILLDKFGENSQKRFQNAENLMKEIEKKVKETSRLSSRSRLSRTKTIRSFTSSTNKEKLLNGDYQEIWFPGNHSDVGGGFASDVNGHFLSNLPLRWMFGESVKHGVIFQRDRLVNFAKRYSSIDSMLSCDHDMLSFYSGKLTHSISQVEQQTILELSKAIFNNNYIPEFRSCENNEEVSFQELFNNGVYVNSLKKIHHDLSKRTIEGIEEGLSYENFKIQDIFTFYNSLPSHPIKGFDGHGNSNFWTVLGWWMVEFLPIGTKIEDSDDKWRNCYIPNLGRPRSVPQYSKLHWSVYWRMKYCYDYLPKNLPDYVKKILKDYNLKDFHDINGDHESNLENDEDKAKLISKLVEETKHLFKKWSSEQWKNVPDDLDPILREFNYI